ncbi:oligoendopeptidase F [Mesomycoplasma moatsii]|uniref:oligoendopeptidase F n=1 Tax=Mesomycoplasma moatsii TaxID=171287 RepID=UPI0003B3901A
MKQYKKYSDVPKKYRFDLDSLLNGLTIEELIEKLFKELDKNLKVKDSKYENSQTYLKYLKDQEKITVLFNRVSNYISNNLSINVIDKKNNQLNEDLNFRFFNYQKKLGSETNRIFKNEKKLKEWIQLDEFKNFKKDIQFTLTKKKHKFENNIEEFIKRISRAEISAYEVFSIITNSELNYDYAISSKNKKIKITPANRMQLMLNKDEQIRKTTQKKWINAYLQHKNSLASLLYQHIKNISTWALERKYKSSIESLIDEDKVDIRLLETFYRSVKNNINLFNKFKKVHKKFFEIKYRKKFQSWDIYLPLVKIQENYSIEESQNIVLEALKPLGEEYLLIVNKMFKENWIDYCIVDNKRSGAYSIGSTYGIDKKFILMNHDGKLNSISTLAHEIGHSLHSYFSDNSQPYNLSQYPIFLAEIASIFNELMLNDYLVKNTNNDELKFYLISEAINEFEATVRRQTMWSEYEFEIYNRIDKGEALSTFDALKEVYKNVAKQYSSSENKFKKDEDLYAAIMVPHFYYDFYVYKYAIGYLVANYFFQQYKKQGKNVLKNYIDNFLRKGDSQWPIDLLKEAGIDLYDENFYNDAFQELDEKINEYIRLGKKIF